MKINQITIVSIIAVLLMVLAGCEVAVDKERQEDLARQKEMSHEELCNTLSARYKALDARERVEYIDKEVMQEACHLAGVERREKRRALEQKFPQEGKMIWFGDSPQNDGKETDDGNNQD